MSIQKLNDALGLGDKGIDGFLADLNVDNSSFQDKFSEIDSKVKENVDNIDNQIQEYNKGGLECLDVANLNSSLSELKELIVVSKDVIKQVYETIASSELIDSDLVSSMSNLMEAAHLTIKEYIDLYRDRCNFYDKVRLEQLKQQHKLEQMEIKHKHDMEKLNSTKRNDSIPVQNMMAYSQEKIVGELNDQDKQD